MKKYTLVFLLLILAFCMQISNAQSSVKSSKYISYTDVGNGYPIILIHPFPTDQRLWEPQRVGLKAHFRVITLDLWGFGKSTTTDGSAVTMTTYADEVKQLMNKLHVKKAIIGGESMGGYVALAFIQKYPTNVSGLILSNTQAIGDTDEQKAGREVTAQDILVNGTTKLINGFMPQAVSPSTSARTKHFLHNFFESQTATGMASGLRGMALRNDTTAILANTNIPVLIITSNKDNVINPNESYHMLKLAKNSKLVLIENAAHLTSLEKPEEWNHAVIEMFNQR